MTRKAPTYSWPGGAPAKSLVVCDSALETAVVGTDRGPYMLLSMAKEGLRGGFKALCARLSLDHVRELRADLARAEAAMSGEPADSGPQMAPSTFKVIAGFDDAGVWCVLVKFEAPDRDDFVLRLEPEAAAILARDAAGACEAIRQHQQPTKHS